MDADTLGKRVSASCKRVCECSPYMQSLQTEIFCKLASAVEYVVDDWGVLMRRHNKFYTFKGSHSGVQLSYLLHELCNWKKVQSLSSAENLEVEKVLSHLAQKELIQWSPVPTFADVKRAEAYPNLEPEFRGGEQVDLYISCASNFRYQHFQSIDNSSKKKAISFLLADEKFYLKSKMRFRRDLYTFSHKLSSILFSSNFLNYGILLLLNDIALQENIPLIGIFRNQELTTLVCIPTGERRSFCLKCLLARRIGAATSTWEQQRFEHGCLVDQLIQVDCLGTSSNEFEISPSILKQINALRAEPIPYVADIRSGALFEFTNLMFAHPTCGCLNVSDTTDNYAKVSALRPTTKTALLNLPLESRVTSLQVHRISMISDFQEIKFSPNMYPFPYKVWQARCAYPHQFAISNKRLQTLCISTGVGSTSSEAKTKALVEGIERYCAMAISPEQAKWSVISELKSSALSPSELAFYDKLQYKTDNFPCASYLENDNIPWLLGKNLIGGDKTYVPLDEVSYSSPRPGAVIMSSSSGCAAHFSEEAAICSSIYELIERDAIMLTWLMKRSCPLLAGLKNIREIATVIEWLRQRKFRLICLDISTDLKVPCVLAVILRDDDKAPALSLGACANLDMNYAIIKATREALLSLVGAQTLIKSKEKSGQLESIVGSPLEHSYAYHGASKRSSWEFLVASKESTPIQPFPQINTKQELGYLLGICASSALKIVCVDLTNLEARNLGISVCRCVIPELQPIFFGAGMHRINQRRIEQFAGGKQTINMGMHPFA